MGRRQPGIPKLCLLLAGLLQNCICLAAAGSAAAASSGPNKMLQMLEQSGRRGTAEQFRHMIGRLDEAKRRRVESEGVGAEERRKKGRRHEHYGSDRGHDDVSSERDGRRARRHRSSRRNDRERPSSSTSKHRRRSSHHHRRHHKRDRERRRHKRRHAKSSSSYYSSSSSSSSPSPPRSRRARKQQIVASEAFKRKQLQTKEQSNAPPTRTVPLITEKDYYAKHKEFAEWLEMKFDKKFIELDSLEATRYFSRFVDQWNSGILNPKWYGWEQENIHPEEAYHTQMKELFERPQPSKPFRRHGKIDSHGEGANKDGKKDTARGGGRSSTDSALANMDLEKRVKVMSLMDPEECAHVLASMGPEKASEMCSKLDTTLVINAYLALADTDAWAVAMALPVLPKELATKILGKMDRTRQQRILLAKRGAPGELLDEDSDFENVPEITHLTDDQLQAELRNARGLNFDKLPLSKEQREQVELQKRDTQRRKQLEARLAREVRTTRRDGEDVGA